jgi:hypothetical protein
LKNKTLSSSKGKRQVILDHVKPMHVVGNRSKA